jgi:hypothetical protein
VAGEPVSVWVAGLRRFAVLAFAMLVITIVLGLAYDLIGEVSIRRALSVTGYALGALFVVLGVFHGLRPPIRIDNEEGSPGMFGVLLTRGKVRNATEQEREEALGSSVLLVSLGAVLIVFGAILDPVHRIF